MNFVEKKKRGTSEATNAAMNEAMNEATNPVMNAVMNEATNAATNEVISDTTNDIIHEVGDTDKVINTLGASYRNIPVDSDEEMDDLQIAILASLH